MVSSCINHKMLLPVLELKAVTRRFGGLVANDAIDLSIAAGEIHALIGSNGAGKSTLIAQIAGELVPTSGRIIFDGADVTALPAHKRALAGLAQTFQITSIFPALSVFENVALAAQAHCGHSFRFWTPVQTDAAVNTGAHAALQEAGLENKTGLLASDLSHGEHRQLEIAMALAGRPKLLLMDEPTAGMGPSESRDSIALIRRVARGRTVFLVEHDMDVVFALADRITVLDNGQVIASGAPDEVRASEQVRMAYLGREAPPSPAARA
jgi:branched-chain amino acid transport system ATP-binding protein